MTQKREQLLVGRPVCPAGVDRVAVHREEIARVGSFARPEPPIFFEVFHVQADGDERRVVGGTNR